MKDDSRSQPRRGFGRDVVVGAVSAVVALAVGDLWTAWSFSNFEEAVGGPRWLAFLALPVIVGQVALSCAAANVDRRSAGGMTWGALLYFTGAATLAGCTILLGVLRG